MFTRRQLQLLHSLLPGSSDEGPTSERTIASLRRRGVIEGEKGSLSLTEAGRDVVAGATPINYPYPTRIQRRILRLLAEGHKLTYDPSMGLYNEWWLDAWDSGDTEHVRGHTVLGLRRRGWIEDVEGGARITEAGRNVRGVKRG